MVFGTATNTYTAPGITSAASKAAQSGTTQFVTSDNSGNLATTDGSSLVANSAAFQQLQTDVQRNTEGIAMAIALGGGAILPPCKNAAITVNAGVFERETAVGISGAARLDDNISANLGVGVGCNQGTVGGRAGFTVAW